MITYFKRVLFKHLLYVVGVWHLQNCIANDTPIRVTRGHENKSSYTGKIYTYDGLYKVIIYE